MYIEVAWKERMQFEGRNREGHKVALDAYEKVGGDGVALRPKELMLASLAGCTAMDVLAILRKMKQEPEAFSVEVEAEETAEHPKVFTAFHIRYRVRGDVAPEKLEKAINLSQERYCGVTVMYSQFATVTHDFEIE